MCDVALCSYVVLLARLRNLAAERELKLTYLSSQPQRRRTPAPAYDLSAGYGDLAVRRMAN